MHPYRTRVSGTAVIGQGVVKHVWVAPNTASAAFSHREGSMVTQVAVTPAGQPRHMLACGCVLEYADKRLTIFITYTHPG